MSVIVFLRNVWREEAYKFSCCNQLANLGKRTGRAISWVFLHGRNTSITRLLPTEGLIAEVGQLIARIKFCSFLAPDMASKNDARHGIGLTSHWLIDAMHGIVFTPCLASKIWQTLYTQSIAQLRQTSLHLTFITKSVRKSKLEVFCQILLAGNYFIQIYDATHIV